MTSELTTPEPGEEVAWVRAHLADLCCDEPAASPSHHGSQTAADQALAAFDVAGYASRRNHVLPASRRGASGLSPWIRHGLLTLPLVWDHVAEGPPRDRAKFRDELLWQEYARHIYARLGRGLGESLRGQPHTAPEAPDDPWTADPDMACMAWLTSSLHTDGWLVNQTRMWAASHWTVRHGAPWQRGEDVFFTHLLDGSRAANRLGWQWTVGAGTQKAYGFSRWQVQKRAPELCRGCALSEACPIQDWPADRSLPGVDVPDPRIREDADPVATGGPLAAGDGQPDAVWLTAESLGDQDPALAAHPDLPAIFVFDEPLLARLGLSGKRLVFLTQALADLGTRRAVEVHRGDPRRVLADRDVAVTWAPVPGFAARSAAIDPAVLHPWSWLVRPHGRSVQSFSAWRKGAGR